MSDVFKKSYYNLLDLKGGKIDICDFNIKYFNNYNNYVTILNINYEKYYISLTHQTNMIFAVHTLFFNSFDTPSSTYNVNKYSVLTTLQNTINFNYKKYIKLSVFT